MTELAASSLSLSLLIKLLQEGREDAYMYTSRSEFGLILITPGCISALSRLISRSCAAEVEAGVSVPGTADPGYRQGEGV